MRLSTLQQRKSPKILLIIYFFLHLSWPYFIEIEISVHQCITDFLSVRRSVIPFGDVHRSVFLIGGRQRVASLPAFPRNGLRHGHGLRSRSSLLQYDYCLGFRLPLLFLYKYASMVSSSVGCIIT